LKVVRYLAALGCAASRIVRGDLERFAVVTRPSATCGHDELVIRVVADSVSILQRTRDIGGSEPNHIQWIHFHGLRGDALVLSFDSPVEGSVGTVMYGDTGDGSLSRIYTEEATTCAPAELRDLDGDGEPELISYQEDPSAGDCDSPCHIAIKKHLNMIPAWLRVKRWDGKGWVGAERQHPAFYAELARRYEALDTWVRSDSSGAPCRSAYWFTDAELFRTWAARSDSLAAH
jgi:hypothetical protein